MPSPKDDVIFDHRHNAADRVDRPRMAVSGRPEDTRDQGLYSGEAGIGCFG
jgi:hypothetical protein